MVGTQGAYPGVQFRNGEDPHDDWKLSCTDARSAKAKTTQAMTAVYKTLSSQHVIVSRYKE